MNSNNKIAFSMNYASHYREVIYKMINDELDADFYFGDSKRLTIKKLDFSKLSNFRKEFKTIEFKKLIWFRGNNKLVFKDYDTIVLTGEPRILNNWIMLLLAKVTGRKIYFWTHGWYGRETKTRALFKKPFFNLAHKIFLYGDYAKELMIKQGFKSEKLIPIYNSLDYDTQKRVRNKLTDTDIFKNHFGNNNPVIFFIGRLQKNKNLEQVLDAMILLKEQNKDYNFVVIGKEEPGYDFNNEIVLRGLDNNVWMYGACYEEQKLGELIYNSKVCVTPSSIGLTAIHSLMYGTPVITNDNFPHHGPEFEAITDGYNGAFFEKDNIENLANKIDSVVKSNYSKEQCWEIVDNKWNPHNQIEIFKKELIE